MKLEWSFSENVDSRYITREVKLDLAEDDAQGTIYYNG